ncbi:hypothetical protein SCB49_07967 [unidentified eubacterium SCB49]|nr:hypothetical protein SCB49_07967 [unidentified eubacterium SCB49]
MNPIENIQDWNNIIAEINSADVETLYNIANYFDHGLIIDEKIIVEIDKKKAFATYKKASEKGHIESKTRLADFYSEGEYCQKNIEYAIQLYKDAIENKSPIAAHNLATIYRDLEKFEKSFECYLKEQELGKSMVIQLAYCYYFGIGTKADKKQALKIFETIVENKTYSSNYEYEIEDAYYYIGLYYLNGEVVGKSIERARSYFKIANKDNDHRSANEILLMIGK